MVSKEEIAKRKKWTIGSKYLYVPHWFMALVLTFALIGFMICIQRIKELIIIS